MSKGATASTLSVTPSLTDEVASFEKAFDLIDVSKYDLETMPAAEQVELHQALEAQIMHALQIQTLAMRPLIEARAALHASIIKHIEASGGKSLSHHRFNVNGIRKPAKKMEKLIELRDHVDGAELSEAVFAVAKVEKLPSNQTPEQLDRLREILPGVGVSAQTVLDKAPRNLAPETIAELEAAFPGVEVEVEIDADGRKLNSLLKKYGPNSEIGKIILEGYTEAGPISLEITPRESAMKSIGAA